MKDKLCRSLSLISPPTSIWIRTLLLLSGLILIKLSLLLHLKKELFQAHFRILHAPNDWVARTAFFTFLGLSVATLVRFGSRCNPLGVKALRTANYMVLGLGLICIVWTFGYAGGSLPFLIIAKGLKVTSAIRLFGARLFVTSPYLAGWLLAYGVALFALIRTGHEVHSISLTALFACAYALTFLRGLMELRSELLLADAIGIVAFGFGLRSTRMERPAWLIAPFAWAFAFLFVLFEGASSLVIDSPYIIMLFVETAILFTLTTMISKDKSCRFFDAWICPLPFYAFGFFLIISHGYPEAANLNNFFSEAFELPHYFIGEAVLAIIFMEAANVYCRLWPKAWLWPCDVAAVLLATVSFLDMRLTQITGVRLNWDVLSFANSPKMVWRMAQHYLPAVILVLAVAVLFYGFILRWIEVWCRPKPGAVTSRAVDRASVYVACVTALAAFLGLFMIDMDKGNGSALFNVLQSHPLWRSKSTPLMTGDQLRSKVQSLELGSLSGRPEARSRIQAGELNLLFILMESTYNSYLPLFSGTEDTQPRLSAYKDRMEVFPNFFSSFAGSIWSRFATFTSLYPVLNYNAFTINHIDVKSMFEVLHEFGYRNSMFYSSYYDYTGFRSFLKQRCLDDMYDADTMPGPRTLPPLDWGLPETETVSAICNQLQSYSTNHEKFFLTYIPAAPHYPCDGIPKEFQKFGTNSVPSPANYKTLYMNSLLYMDSMIASILNQLEKSGLLDKTLVIITSDHGEMLGVNGGPIGHGWRITPILANVPLIVMDPKNPGYKINYVIGSQLDLLPTVLDLLGIDVPENQRYEGESLYAVGKQRDHLIYLNSFQEFGIIRGDKFFCCTRALKDGDKRQNLPRAFYTITNKGSSTIFTLETNSIPARFSIRSFDDFQNNLLANYSAYCKYPVLDRQTNGLMKVTARGTSQSAP